MINGYTTTSDTSELRLQGGNTAGLIRYWWGEQNKELVRLESSRFGSIGGIFNIYARANDSIASSPFFQTFSAEGFLYFQLSLPYDILR